MWEELLDLGVIVQLEVLAIQTLVMTTCCRLRRTRLDELLTALQQHMTIARQEEFPVVIFGEKMETLDMCVM